MEIEKQLERALARIADLNTELGREPSSDPVLALHNDPVRVAASQLENQMRKRLREVGGKLRQANENLAHAKTFLDRDDANLKAYGEDQIAELNEKLQRFNGHKAALMKKLEVLESDPKSLFLPLGTVVRFTGNMGYETCDDFQPMRGAYPVDGTPGVVVRLNSDSEWPITVAWRRKFKDTHGDVWTPSDDRFITHHFDLASLEVVEPGYLPNGDEMESFGYVATHHREPNSINERETEMVIEADGFFWRFIEYGNPKVLEAGSAHKDIAEMSWILDPIDPPSSHKF
jgi:hypothetical protein